MILAKINNHLKDLIRREIKKEAKKKKKSVSYYDLVTDQSENWR
jgi:hypothetical protein